MEGLLLMTDNSCNKFPYRILNDITFFFKEKKISLETTHRFNIYISVWCRAKIFDIDQAGLSAS